MVADGTFAEGDIYLDYGISGKYLSRPGFDAIQQRVYSDLLVSHVFVPRRDRLARPDNPVDAVALEFKLRSAGVCIVTLDKILKPFEQGARIDMADLLTAVIEYDSSGRFRSELAQKLILAKIKLAEAGWSIGGEPPYGFERWLVGPDGTRDRKLALSEHVKRPGYHVLWLPTADSELKIIHRIREEVLTMPVSRIARRLNDEGVPSPKAGRERTIGTLSKRRVKNSGLWMPNTIKNIVTHPLLIAICESGKRSMGDQKRMCGRSIRNLNEGDYDGGKLVTVENPLDSRIRVPGRFEALMTPVEQSRIVTILNDRGRHLKGKARARIGTINPLGGRIYDMTCGWLMYRNAKRKQWRYSCGFYMNSDAKRCSHNMVNGEAATRFVLSSIRQRVFSASAMKKLEAKIKVLASSGRGVVDAAGERVDLIQELAKSRHRKEIIGKNLALAENPDQFRAISQSFEEAGRDVQRLEDHLRSLPTALQTTDPASEVEAAMKVIHRLREFGADATPENMGVTDLIRKVDARLYLKFDRVEQGRRVMCLISGGVLTFGQTPPPVPMYHGKTDRAIVRQMMAAGESVSAGLGKSSSDTLDTGAEVRGSGNVQRVTKLCT